MYYKEKGIAIGIILLSVALIAAISGAIAVSLNTKSIRASAETAKSNAAALIMAANAQRQAYERLLSNGVSADDIELSNQPVVGLYHPNAGGSPKFTHPSSIYRDPPPWCGVGCTVGSPAWRIKYNISIAGVGTDSGSDTLLHAFALTRIVCTAINYHLGIAAFGASPPVSSVGSAIFWSAFKLTPVDATTDAALYGKTEICIRTVDGVYVYYTTLNAQ